jgi:zinc-finger of transposase IS204/IS1001/IS1096/IS1165
MNERSGDASALLGMDGFVVLSQLETDEEIWLLVETEDDVMSSPRCGTRAVGHGRSVVQVRDLSIRGNAVRLVWRKSPVPVH